MVYAVVSKTISRKAVWVRLPPSAPMIKGVDHIGITVTYACHDGKGNFLLSKRSLKTRDEQGMWEFGGGGLEFGETVEKGLARELKEEYGAKILKSEFLGFRNVHREQQGKKTHWLALDFKVLIDPKQVRNGEPEMIEELSWFRLDKLPNNQHSQLPIYLKLHKHKL